MKSRAQLFVALAIAANLVSPGPAVAATDCLPTEHGPEATLKGVDGNPPITGHPAADSRIRHLAEVRGYRLHPRIADEQDLVFPYSVHRCVMASWRRLRAEAAENGFELSIVSGYRSVVKQRQIFLSKLGMLEIDPEAIALGTEDERIRSILEYSSIPGYSRHHTGFTIDIQYNNEGLNAFGQSPAYRWISRDNFANARRFGFLPSYPEELPGQGPVPEPWEFIWVGDLATAGNADGDADDGVVISAARRILAAIESTPAVETTAATGPEPSPVQAAAVQTLPGGG
jgi:hypothetical protein